MSINYKSLCFDLPEDLDRAKKSGNFEKLEKLLDLRLSSGRLTPILRDRLTLEKMMLSRFTRRYLYSRDEALALCKCRIRDFTEEEFDFYEDSGLVDYIYTQGGKRYVSSFCSTLIKTVPSLGARRTDAPEELDDGTAFYPFYEDIRKNGSVKYRFRIKSSLKIEDEAFQSGETYSVHLPVPAPCAQQVKEDICVFTAPDALISGENAAQRTVYFKRRLTENRPFEYESAFTSQINYVDPFRDAPHIVYPLVPAPCADDVSEQYPHIVFTPYLKQLAAWIVGEEKRPLYQAKKIYDYITLNVRYTFMRSYLTIERQAEFCALNLKGDCGIQAILFITLCRILGIPARWQSGWTVDKFTTGDHDWAQFYTEEFGWLFADPSYGGGGTRQEDEVKRNFYFGNVDPFRMVANRRYMSEFEPAKRHLRNDPCDSQDGEVETETGALDSNCYDKTDETVLFELVAE
ncbi:MAG: transglutaminase domain-containing protein [Clostridia bacterium]|nr:transglutaminase domain-containing protein [Clostridia bacterium]